MVSQPSTSDSEDDHEFLQYKLVILGDGAVGKTSLSLRFSEDKFSKSYKQTIGVDFFLKQLTLPGDKRVAVQLWDIGGQTIASRMVSNYIYGAQAILLTYDITNFQSFRDLEDWMSVVQKVYTQADMPYLAILANKADLTHMRTVRPAQHTEFADLHKMHSFFVSAKTGDNVATAFYRIVADIADVILTLPDISNAAKVLAAKSRQAPRRRR
ncbi:hypothetical protein WJX77_008815 [Trebouxia sp. C0004]